MALPLVALSACAEKEGSEEQLGAGQTLKVDAVPVETLILQPQDFTLTFTTAGEVEANEDVTVSAEVAGRITEISYDLGDRVSRGELLVGIDDATYQAQIRQIEAQLARARTQLASAQRDLDRNRDLLKTSAVSEKVVEDWESQVQAFQNDVAAQEAALEVAQVTFDRTRIYSPIDGYISQKHVSFGEYVMPGQRLYDIVETDRVKFVFSLAERDVPKVQLDEELKFSIDAWTGHEFEGPVKAIAPAGNQATRTFRVELAMANSEETPLRPGMSGRAHVIRGRYEDVYLVPEDAVLREEEGGVSYIYVTNDEKADPVEVDVVSSTGPLAVVRANLKPGATAIILGQHAVEAGSAIRVRRTHEEPPVMRFD